jgi:hypothetical protein
MKSLRDRSLILQRAQPGPFASRRTNIVYALCPPAWVLTLLFGLLFMSGLPSTALGFCLSLILGALICLHVAAIITLTLAVLDERCAM